MILLWLALLVSSVHSNSYTEYYNYCITKGTENRTSWLVAIHNLDTGKHFNGALISDRHLLTIKDAVTSIQDGVEKMTSDFANRLNLQAVTDDHKLVTLKAKHIVIPVDYNGKTKETRLLDLAIVELDSPTPDGVNFVCPNGRYYDTPNYPPCNADKGSTDGRCDKLLKGYRFSTYNRTFSDNTWGSNFVPFPDHSNFISFCWHVLDGKDNVWFKNLACHGIHDTIMHNYLNQSEGGEEGRAGDVFVSGTLTHWNDTLHGLTVDQIGFAQLHGLGINETSAISLNYWEEFICQHTGACFLGMVSPDHPLVMHASPDNWRPFLRDGILKLGKCAGQRNRQLKNELPSTWSIVKTKPLTPSEFNSIHVKCGFKEDHEEWPVRIFRPSVHLNGSDPIHICTGSFISRRHVITSKSCVIPHMHRSLTIQYGPKKEGWLRSHLPLDHTPKYYTSDVRFVIYAGEIGTGSDQDIAVLELTKDISTTTDDSMIMCVPTTSGWGSGEWHMKQYEHGGFGISDDFFTMQWHGYEYRNESVTARLFEFEDLLKSTVKSKYGPTDRGSPLAKSFLSHSMRVSGKDRKITYLWGITTDLSASPFLIYVYKNIALVCKMSGVCPGGGYQVIYDDEIYANGQQVCE